MEAAHQNAFWRKSLYPPKDRDSTIALFSEIEPLRVKAHITCCNHHDNLIRKLEPMPGSPRMMEVMELYQSVSGITTIALHSFKSYIVEILATCVGTEISGTNTMHLEKLMPFLETSLKDLDNVNVMCESFLVCLSKERRKNPDGISVLASNVEMKTVQTITCSLQRISSLVKYSTEALINIPFLQCIPDKRETGYFMCM